MSTPLKYTLARIPVLGRLLLMAYRLKIGLRYILQPLVKLIGWIFKSREVTNYTYDLTARNRLYLAHLLSCNTRVPLQTILGYFEELENNSDLKTHILEETRKHEDHYLADRAVRFGRRLGWYALVRVLKPRVVIETGVDKGLGSCLLAEGLRKNTEEGFPGRYYGTEINPRCGYLLTGLYGTFGEILYGDSIETLKSFSQEIDLFINDSDHSTEYEMNEYRVIEGKLSPKAYILGDNAHDTDKLARFSEMTGRSFVFFKEEPADHWYPGAGIGISFPGPAEY